MSSELARVDFAIISTMSETGWGGSEELWFRVAFSLLKSGNKVAVITCAKHSPQNALQPLIEMGAVTGVWYDENRSLVRNLLDINNFLHPYSELFECRPIKIIVSMGGVLDLVERHPMLGQILISYFPQKFDLLFQSNSDLIQISEDGRLRLAKLIDSANQVLFVSKSNQIDCERQIANSISHAKILLNPIVSSEFDEGCSLPLNYRPENLLVMVCVARLDAFVKGLDILIEAMSKLHWPTEKWKLNIYGVGKDESYLRRLIEKFDLQQNIFLCGFERDRRRIWREGHVLVLPSRLEGMSLAMLEAAYYGRPVLITAVGGAEEFVYNNYNGFVAKAGSVESICRALESLWYRRDSLSLIGANAKRSADEYLLRFKEHLANYVQSLDDYGSTVRQRQVEFPLVSIIITCYNYGKFLKQCINSVLVQTYQNIEVVVVDDGSTDDTYVILNSIEKELSHKIKIRILRQKNSGEPAIARNAGIDFASGAFLLPLDADDILATNAVERFIEAFVRNPVAELVYGNYLGFSQNSFERRVTGDWSAAELRKGNPLCYSSMYRRSLWEKVGGYGSGVRGYEDWDFWCKCFVARAVVVKINSDTLFYRIKPDGLFGDARDKHEILFEKIRFNSPSLFA
jgi:glycosyltransferase involved in cell wall biosynthesis